MWETHHSPLVYMAKLHVSIHTSCHIYIYKYLAYIDVQLRMHSTLDQHPAVRITKTYSMFVEGYHMVCVIIDNSFYEGRLID